MFFVPLANEVLLSLTSFITSIFDFTLFNLSISIEHWRLDSLISVFNFIVKSSRSFNSSLLVLMKFLKADIFSLSSDSTSFKVSICASVLTLISPLKTISRCFASLALLISIEEIFVLVSSNSFCNSWISFSSSLIISVFCFIDALYDSSLASRSSLAIA